METDVKAHCRESEVPSGDTKSVSLHATKLYGTDASTKFY